MKFIKYFAVFVILLTSCKTKKNLMNANIVATEMSAKKVARKHFASNFDKKSIEAKLKATFNNGKINQSISVNMRIKKDEVIWLKGTKFIIIFKIKITPTSVSYYSPFAKNYFDGDFSMLSKLLGTDINFEQLQNLLLGQSLQNVREEKQNVIIKDNSYVLSPEIQENLFDVFFAINPSHFKLDQQSIVNSLKNQRLDIFYPSYNLVDDEVFPAEIKIKAKQLNKFTNIDFLLKSVVFDTDFDTSFSIPNGYKKINL